MELRKDGKVIRSDSGASQVVDIDPNGTVELVDDDRVIAIFGRNFIRVDSPRHARARSEPADYLYLAMIMAAIGAIIITAVLTIVGGISTIIANLEPNDADVGTEPIVISFPDSVVAEKLIQLSQPEMVIDESTPIVYDVPLSRLIYRLTSARSAVPKIEPGWL